MSSKLAYLSKYTNDDTEQHKKKKKKKKKKHSKSKRQVELSTEVHDLDADGSLPPPIDEDEEDEEPLNVVPLDELPSGVVRNPQRWEQEENGSQPPRRRHDSFSASDAERRRDSDSPPPRNRRRRHDSDSDSPSPRRKRRRHDSDNDASPVRRRHDSVDSEDSMVLKRRYDERFDYLRKGCTGSPSGRRRRHDSEDDDSPPRKRYDSDDESTEHVSRRRRHDSDDDDSDSLPRKRHDSDKESTEGERMSSGHVAGLQKSHEFQKAEAELQRRKKEEAQAMVDRHGMGKTVFRDRAGKKVHEPVESKRIPQLDEEAQRQLNMGRKQKLELERAKQEWKNLQRESFARHADHDGLEQQKKEEIRAEDPMAMHALKKKAASSSKPMRPTYKGPSPKPNRFGIRPGYRWDGVDRGNGFEDKVLARQYSVDRKKEEAYRWSSADM